MFQQNYLHFYEMVDLFGLQWIAKENHAFYQRKHVINIQILKTNKIDLELNGLKKNSMACLWVLLATLSIFRRFKI